MTEPQLLVFTENTKHTLQATRYSTQSLAGLDLNNENLHYQLNYLHLTAGLRRKPYNFSLRGSPYSD